MVRKDVIYLERMMNKISKRSSPKISAGTTIVRLEDGEYKFLMMRSGNYWEASAKGRMEQDESEFETALRETEEETGIKPDELNFKWGRIKYRTEPYAKNKIAIFYLAETEIKDISLPYNPEIGKKEHDEYVWMTYDSAMKLRML